MSILPAQSPKDKDGNDLTLHHMREQGYVVLPFNQDQFKQFITGLLGSPQSITKQISGSFNFDISDINNLYQLLLQRITQQNNGMLAKFSAVIVFSDNSLVEINSLPELLSYNETRPIVSDDIHLSWDYLIHFPDKPTPERQRIQISILTAYEGKSQKLLDDLKVKWKGYGAGVINFRIEYTARTWGTDIEALLTNHIKASLTEPSRIRKFFYDHDTLVGVLSILILWGTLLFGAFASVRSFSQQQSLLVSRLLGSNVNSPEEINSTLHQILSLVAEGSWAQHIFIVLIFLFIGGVLGVFLGAWVSRLSVWVGFVPSFLLLSKESVKERKKTLKNVRKNWWLFVSSFFINIALGVTSNYIFLWLTTR